MKKEKIIIESGGNVGGETNPNEKLEVKNSKPKKKIIPYNVVGTIQVRKKKKSMFKQNVKHNGKLYKKGDIIEDNFFDKFFLEKFTDKIV